MARSAAVYHADVGIHMSGLIVAIIIIWVILSYKPAPDHPIGCDCEPCWRAQMDTYYVEELMFLDAFDDILE